MLKKRVRLLAGNKPKAIKSDDSDTVSVISEKSDRGTFITGTKVEPRPDSPTQLAIKALAIYNKQPLPEEEQQLEPYHLQDVAMQETEKLEEEMKAMFKDLEEMEKLIKGDDLEEMSVVMDDTKDTIEEHGTAFVKLRKTI